MCSREHAKGNRGSTRTLRFGANCRAAAVAFTDPCQVAGGLSVDHRSMVAVWDRRLGGRDTIRAGSLLAPVERARARRLRVSSIWRLRCSSLRATPHR